MMRGPGPMGPRNNISNKRNFDTRETFRKIIKYSKPFLAMVLVSIILAIVGQVFNIVGPERMGKITNIITDEIKNHYMNYYGGIFNGGDIFRADAMNEVIKQSIILAVIFVIGYVCQLLQTIFMADVVNKLTKKLRSDLSLKMNKLPLSYYDSRTTGDIMSIISNDVETFSQSVLNSVTTIISSITAVVGIGVMMFLVSWHLALINIVMIPIAIVFMMITMKISQKHFIANSKFTGLITGNIEEAYTGHDVIKVFNADIEIKEKFDENNKKLKSAGLKSQFLSGILFPIMNFLSNISYLLVAVVGGILATRGIINIGDIQSMIMYSRRFSNPVVMMGQSLNMVQSALASANRIFNYLDAPELSNESNLIPLNNGIEGRVRFEHIKFGYSPDKEIIHDFSLDVSKGQKIAIVGPTGAGKTTLVNLLMKFYESNSGTIYLDDIDIKNIRREDVCKNFSMVLQDTWLFQGTIRENLIFNQEDISNDDLKRIAKLTHVHHFIKSLSNGYDTFIEDDSQVSQGQRQLLTITRAMIKKSNLLILDEATSNVDTRTEILIQDAMDQLMKDKTSFIIAHRLSTIKNADKILVLNEGNIVEIGNHEELLALNGFYTKLYNAQFEE